MRFRLQFWKLEAKLACLAILETLLSFPVLLLVVEAPIWLNILRWMYGFAPQQLAAILLVAVTLTSLIRAVWPRSKPREFDEPMEIHVSSHPELRVLIEGIKRDLGVVVGKKLLVALSPQPWRRLGVDISRLCNLRREVIVPVGCLTIWSALDLSIYLAHARVRRRLPAWLYQSISRSIDLLSAESYQNALQSMPSWRARAFGWLLSTLNTTQIKWQVWADIEADAKIANVQGAPTVVKWIEKSGLAGLTVPICIAAHVEPALRRGILVPIADSCEAFQEHVIPTWHLCLREQLRSMEQEKSESDISPEATRIIALEHHPSRFLRENPNPARSIFDQFNALEESVVRHELGLTAELSFARIGPEEVVRLVVIPQMKGDIERNEHLLAGKTLEDVPRMAHDISTLALSYVEDDRYLFATSQREELIPQLLASFMTLQLLERGWTVHSWVGEVVLEKGGKKLNSVTVIDRLKNGEMTESEFLLAIEGLQNA